jgi:rhamnogalacturonyl hydrolase YesR
MGIELESMLDTYLKYGGEDIRKYCQEYTDTMINQKGEIRTYDIKDYNLDQIRTGHFVARMYQLYPEKKNLLAIQTLMKQLKDQPRTVQDKVFWHKAIYSYQVWLDGIFMGLPFYTMTARDLLKAKDAKKIYDDAVDQISVTYQRTFDPKTGLNRHAWDETKQMFWADPVTGQSAHCWGRALGWYTMALVEVLPFFPEGHPGKAELKGILEGILATLPKYADPETGMWYQVLDSPGREGNYLESTCSAMFTYAYLRAAREGYAVPESIDPKALYEALVKRFIREDEDGTLNLTDCCAVAGLGGKENRSGTFEYYINEKIVENDPKGVGPFIWASLEYEKL